MDERPGRWVDEPPLPILPKAGPGVELALGARLVRVYVIKTVAGQQRRAGFQEIVVIARARLKDGGIGLLAAWIGAWQQGARTTGGPRWAWLRYDPPPPGQLDPLQPMPRSRRENRTEGIAWHGWHVRSDLAQAIRGAAASLPHEQRAAALRPLPDPETPPTVADPATPGDLP